MPWPTPPTVTGCSCVELTRGGKPSCLLHGKCHSHPTPKHAALWVMPGASKQRPWYPSVWSVFGRSTEPAERPAWPPGGARSEAPSPAPQLQVLLHQRRAHLGPELTWVAAQRASLPPELLSEPRDLLCCSCCNRREQGPLVRTPRSLGRTQPGDLRPSPPSHVQVTQPAQEAYPSC